MDEPTTASDAGVPRGCDGVHSLLFRRRHSALLAAIAAAFLVRPLLGDSEVAIVGFAIAMLVLLVAALYAVQADEWTGGSRGLPTPRRRHLWIGWILALAAGAERVFVLFWPSRTSLAAASACWLAFFVFVTFSQLRSVLRQTRVTTETISSAVSVYLLLGFTWGCLYGLFFELQHPAFQFGSKALPLSSPALDPNQALPLLIYFSLTTLATIGFGDITPLSLPARYAAVAEGITGQLYLAILVARLVAMQLGQSDQR